MSSVDSVSSYVEEKLADAARAERLVRARSLVKNYVLGSAGIGFVPLPLADLGALMAVQVKLVHGLAKLYEVPFKENVTKSLVASLLSGASGVVGLLGLASLAKVVPVLGSLAGGGGVALTAASITFATGEVFTRHFESGGSLLDFDPHQMKDKFKAALKRGKGEAAAAEPETTVAA